MWGLLQSSDPKTISQQTVEDHFDGNLCRCTGYRPILHAMKTFASDPPSQSNHPRALALMPQHSELQPYIHQPGSLQAQQPPKLLSFGAPMTWFRPGSLSQLLTMLQQQAKQGRTVQLVCGNTSIGVSKYYNNSGPYNRPDEFDCMIDITAVPELSAHSVTAASTELGAGGLTAGGAVTLSTLVGLLQKNSSQSASYAPLASHLLKVATRQVRNGKRVRKTFAIYPQLTSVRILCRQLLRGQETWCLPKRTSHFHQVKRATKFESSTTHRLTCSTTHRS
jgi:xanthine dehydrogenase/oxidase